MDVWEGICERIKPFLGDFSLIAGHLLMRRVFKRNDGLGGSVSGVN